MESLLPLCPQSVGESNLFPCLCRVGILLLFEFDTLWSPLTVMLTFCPTHGNCTFFPPQWKGECQLVNVGILLLKCECQRGGSSRTVPHIVHREGEKYQWDDICSKTTWLDGTLCAQALTFMPCQNIYCLTALCLYSGQCFALSLLKERFCECLVVFIFLFYLKIITRVKTVWNQPGSSLESAVKNKIWTFQTKNWMLIEAVKTWILSNDQQGVTPIVYESFETWP